MGAFYVIVLGLMAISCQNLGGNSKITCADCSKDMTYGDPLPKECFMESPTKTCQLSCQLKLTIIVENLKGGMVKLNRGCTHDLDIRTWIQYVKDSEVVGLMVGDTDKSNCGPAREIFQGKKIEGRGFGGEFGKTLIPS
ncbi:hypothetical protein HELRODRAFT_182847 [Helobdella robusta]|uniref:Uncharacterized protein n=1 Tax=Helobdella robusta TaxID=6412 RepID=T1FIU9_HELRO|nr:hypothetical protein HELRODRAFT_182847 [Helobdella robusta]ESN90056.1 hypothetical protein HELRODRAFT_182847 [Helobdella robusta]